MTGDDPDSRGVATFSLHTLDVRLETLKRMLDHHDADGALVRSDRTLIEAAIEAAREDLCRVRDRLADIPGDPADPYRATARVMAEAIAELDRLLDVLKVSVRPG